MSLQIMFPLEKCFLLILDPDCPVPVNHCICTKIVRFFFEPLSEAKVEWERLGTQKGCGPDLRLFAGERPGEGLGWSLPAQPGCTRGPDFGKCAGGCLVGDLMPDCSPVGGWGQFQWGASLCTIWDKI